MQSTLQSRSFPRLPLILAAALLATPLAAMPAGANNPNAWVEYDPAVGEPVYAPMTANSVLPGGHVGCAGGVTLTFSNGMRLPVVGVAFGEGKCNAGAPACEPYTSAQPDPVASCEYNPIYPSHQITVPYEITGDITHIPVGCLRTIWIASDANGDGVEDARSPPLTVLGDCD